MLLAKFYNNLPENLDLRTLWFAIHQRMQVRSTTYYAFISVLQGVVDILLVISRYWNSRIGWESWTAPALVPNSQWVRVHIVHFVHRHILCRHTPVQNLKMLSREVIC